MSTDEEDGFALGLACDNSTVQLLWTSSRKFHPELESLNITGLCIDVSGYEQVSCTLCVILDLHSKLVS